VTKIFAKYRNVYDSDALALLETGKDMLDSPLLRYCESVEQSKDLNRKEGPMIILSASGMATGGRILHHLARRLPEPNNTVLLVGYQAVATRGRLLQEGAKRIKIHGEEVKVKAQVTSIDGFSSHADYQEILTWLGHFTRPPKSTFLVHGEPDSLTGLQRRIADALKWNVVIAEEGKTVEL